MSKESLEHLSSLMDGEFSGESGLFLTRRVSSDEAMCATWERYHLIRDCIRQPGSKQLVSGLSVKISKSLEAEDIPNISQRRNNRWLKPVSGMAIAASVALLAIVVTGPQTIVPGEGGTSISSTPNQPFVSPNTLPLSPLTQPVSFSMADTNRLKAYLLRHNQMAGTAGRQGFVSFVPIVATSGSSVAEASGDSSQPEQPGSETDAKKNK